jgi:integrase
LQEFLFGTSVAHGGIFMATIRRRNGRYHVQVRRKGFPPITGTFSRLTVARKWIASIESDIENKTYIDYSEAETTTLNGLLERYETDILPSKKGKNVERYRIGTLRQHLGHYCLSDLSLNRVRVYRDIRLKTLSPSSLKRELVILSRILKLASQDWGIALPHGNPVPQLSLPKTDHARTRRLEPGEERRLLQGIEQGSELDHIIRLALETGMRRGEILSLQREDIDLVHSTLLIRLSKNGEPRTIPLSSVARNVLRAQLSASQWVSEGVIRLHKPSLFSYTPRGLSGAFLRLCRRIEIDDLRFHDLRHEATSRFFEKGLNPVEVATITGHKDTKMLMRYTHLRAEDLASKLG